MAYTTVNKSTDYFNIKLYTGNGSAGHAITGVGFAPDWTWIKNKGASAHHTVFDRVRGATKAIYTNQTDAETTVSGHITAFGSDGFTLGDNSGKGSTNENNKNYAAWNWKAGGAGSSNSDGSITSTVSTNTTAGFSIVSYTGTGSAATVGHGLGVAPKLIIIKNRSSAESWRVYHNALGATKEIYLDLTASAGTSSSSFNDTEPTSSVFSVGTGNGTNKSSENLIAYCFAEKKGYSKFGSYTGNGNSDGPFVYTGFRPAWVMYKPTDQSDHWEIHDNKRDTFNPMDTILYANRNNAESDPASTTDRLDFLSNGFKIRTGSSDYNGNGNNYIYIAFAESPFVNANRIPNNAR